MIPLAYNLISDRSEPPFFRQVETPPCDREIPDSALYCNRYRGHHHECWHVYDVNSGRVLLYGKVQLTTAQGMIVLGAP
jgi:hypothetical protein